LFFFLYFIFFCLAHTPGLNIITEYLMGYILPGKPIANVCFKVYGYMSMSQAVSFLQDFKLGHYMKIPPRSMFLVQVCYAIFQNSHSPPKFYIYNTDSDGWSLTQLMRMSIKFCIYCSAIVIAFNTPLGNNIILSISNV